MSEIRVMRHKIDAYDFSSEYFMSSTLFCRICDNTTDVILFMYSVLPEEYVFNPFCSDCYNNKIGDFWKEQTAIRDRNSVRQVVDIYLIQNS